MMERKALDITCIRCPLGCALRVSVDEEPASTDSCSCNVSVEGNKCARGARYGAEEAVRPRRMVTACVCAAGSLEPVSAKTAAPVERDRVRDVARAISELEVALPVRAGDVLAVDIASTGVAVIATKSVGC